MYFQRFMFDNDYLSKQLRVEIIENCIDVWKVLLNTQKDECVYFESIYM